MHEFVTRSLTKASHALLVSDALSLSRATFYRLLAPVAHRDKDVELRDHVQRIALEWPAYGYRRIAHQLRREGIKVNHKRVLHLMREDNLLVLRKQSFIRATDSRHTLGRYPNLAPELSLTGINQLWVPDITYIRLQREFIYLTVIPRRLQPSLCGLGARTLPPTDCARRLQFRFPMNLAFP